MIVVTTNQLLRVETAANVPLQAEKKDVSWQALILMFSYGGGRGI